MRNLQHGSNFRRGTLVYSPIVLQKLSLGLTMEWRWAYEPAAAWYVWILMFYSYDSQMFTPRRLLTFSQGMGLLIHDQAKPGVTMIICPRCWRSRARISLKRSLQSPEIATGTLTRPVDTLSPRDISLFIVWTFVQESYYASTNYVRWISISQ